MRASATIHPDRGSLDSEAEDGSRAFSTRPHDGVGRVPEEISREKSRTGQSLDRATTKVGARLSSHREPRMSEHAPEGLGSPSYSSEESTERTESVFNLETPMRSHTLRLPELSVYTLAFVGTASRPETSYDWSSPKFVLGVERREQPKKWSAIMMMTTGLQCYLPLLYVLSLQCFVLYTLWQHVVKGGIAATAIHTCRTNYLIRLACLHIFIARAFYDMGQSLNYLGWLVLLPTTSEHKELRRTADGRMDPTWGFTERHKWVNFWVVCVPKMGVGFLLFLVGVSFIALSDNDTDLIIDTLAITFVLDIDHTVFQLCISNRIKTCAERIPPMEVIIRPDEEHKRQQKQAREEASKHTVADTAIAATAGSRDNSPNVDDSDRYSATTRTRRRWRFSLRGRRSRRAKTAPHDDAIYLPARFINAKRFVAILQASVNSLRISALVSAHISAHSLESLPQAGAAWYDRLVEFAIDQLLGILTVSAVAFAVDWKICDERIVGPDSRLD